MYLGEIEQSDYHDWPFLIEIWVILDDSGSDKRMQTMVASFNYQFYIIVNLQALSLMLHHWDTTCQKTEVSFIHLHSPLLKHTFI